MLGCRYAEAQLFILSVTKLSLLIRPPFKVIHILWFKIGPLGGKYWGDLGFSAFLSKQGHSPLFSAFLLFFPRRTTGFRGYTWNKRKGSSTCLFFSLLCLLFGGPFTSIHISSGHWIHSVIYCSLLWSWAMASNWRFCLSCLVEGQLSIHLSWLSGSPCSIGRGKWGRLKWAILIFVKTGSACHPWGCPIVWKIGA